PLDVRIAARVSWGRDTNTPPRGWSNHGAPVTSDAGSVARPNCKPGDVRGSDSGCSRSVRVTSYLGTQASRVELLSGDPVPVRVEDREQREEERRHNDGPHKRPAVPEAQRPRQKYGKSRKDIAPPATRLEHA